MSHANLYFEFHPNENYDETAREKKRRKERYGMQVTNRSLKTTPRKNPPKWKPKKKRTESIG